MHSEHKLEKKRLHSIKNYKLIQYLKTKEYETLMENNEITTHVATVYILLDGEGTNENFYQFLELQMDNDKKTLETAFRYSGPLRGFE